MTSILRRRQQPIFIRSDNSAGLLHTPSRIGRGKVSLIEDVLKRTDAAANIVAE